MSILVLVCFGINKHIPFSYFLNNAVKRKFKKTQFDSELSADQNKSSHFGLLMHEWANKYVYQYL